VNDSDGKAVPGAIAQVLPLRGPPRTVVAGAGGGLLVDSADVGMLFCFVLVRHPQQNLAALVLVAKDETAAARYIRRCARGHEHLLINKSTTVRELAPFLEKDGFTVVDTYAAEDRSAAALPDIWQQWQLGEPEPQTIWESFDTSPPASFTGKPLPAPTGRWAGVVGLSAASAPDATLYFVQHTHNISKILSCAQKLFVVAGIEKLARKPEEALFQARCTALFGLTAVLQDSLSNEAAAEGTGTGYGVLGTGDGLQGTGDGEQGTGEAVEKLFVPRLPEEVHVILLDAGRRPTLRTRNKKIMECISCRACRRGCMMGGLGTATPRDAALYGLARLPADTEKRGLYDCTLCEYCKSACPLEIPTNEYNLALRRKQAQKGRSPEVFKVQATGIMEDGNPLGEPAAGRGQYYPEARPVKGKVLLYLGCVASFQRQKIVEGAFKVLTAAGKDFTVLGDREVCCGYPLYVAGSRKFEEAARRNLEAIRATGAETLVTTCAGCNKTFRKIYPEHFDLGFEALHLVEYLDRLVSNGELSFKSELKLKAIYHDPCDLGRALGIYDAPRRLLASILGLQPLEFRFNRQSSRCCGAGGGAKGYDPKLSEEHAFQRMKEAADLGADVVTSACPACLANLQIVIPRLKRETGRVLRFMDLVEMASRAIEAK